jgi:hypothetical protein
MMKAMSAGKLKAKRAASSMMISAIPARRDRLFSHSNMSPSAVPATVRR